MGKQPGSLTNRPQKQSIASSQVAYIGDGLQIWRIATNIFDKQSWTADKE
jgi:hypothetical protein